MKKIVLTLVMAVLASASTLAQRQQMSQEDRDARRAEMVEKQAERLAKDFELKDKAKDDFVATYKAYRNELMSTQQQDRPQGRNNERNQDGKKDEKKMTEEDAQKQIDEYFSRQETQLKNQHKRLEIDKKYYSELKKMLSAKQLAKIFRQQRTFNNNRNGGMQRQGGFGQQGGPGGARNFGGGGFDGPGGGF